MSFGALRCLGGVALEAGGRDPLSDIKRGLDGIIGERVRVTANKGRRQVVEREGTLEKTYPSLFVIRLDEGDSNRRVTYTYADVLTEMVKLTRCDVQGDQTTAGFTTGAGL